MVFIMTQMMIGEMIIKNIKQYPMKSSKELLKLSGVDDTESGYVERNARGKKLTKVKSMLKNAVRKMRYRKMDEEDFE